MKKFVWPEVGDGIESVEIIEWLVKPGDVIRAQQEIAEISTDKAVFYVPSPVQGVVKELFGLAGQEVKIGSPMILIEEKESVYHDGK